MIRIINLNKQHHKKVTKFARLLEPFNPNISDSIKLAAKTGFKVRVNDKGKVVGYECSCGKRYVNAGWLQKHVH
jgi:hypothetical protein